MEYGRTIVWAAAALDLLCSQNNRYHPQPSHASPGFLLRLAHSNFACFVCNVQFPTRWSPRLLCQRSFANVKAETFAVRDANVNVSHRVSNSLTRSFIGHPQCYKQREEHLAFEFCSKITTSFSYKAFWGWKQENQCWFLLLTDACDMSSPLLPEPINEANKETVQR